MPVRYLEVNTKQLAIRNESEIRHLPLSVRSSSDKKCWHAHTGRKLVTNALVCASACVQDGQRGERCSSTPVHMYTQLRGHMIITAIAHAHDTARNLICFSRSSSGALRTSKCATLLMRASIKPQKKIQVAKFPALVVRRVSLIHCHSHSHDAITDSGTEKG